MTFAEYVEFVKSLKRYNPKYSVVYPALGLTGEAGEVAEKVKKWVRDEGGAAMSDERRHAILLELGDVQFYITALADDIGYSLDDVISANVNKLSSRRDRDVLHGSGDDR